MDTTSKQDGDNVKKSKLFGNNISPDCVLCDNYDESAGMCLKKKEIKNGKCRKFAYNPTLRVPGSEARMMHFSKEDFEL